VKDRIKENQRTWNEVAPDFFEASALPIWGPFGVGEDLNLIPETRGKTFLEVGCGSGRSIKYLTEHGAKKVYGIDFSETQIAEAKRHNMDSVEAGITELIHAPMEQSLEIGEVDVAFSIYALGWTQEPEKTLANIHSHLKPGGLFIWSWDHSFFSDVEHEDGKYVVCHPYHDESPLIIKDWKRKGFDVNITYRKNSTWFQLLTEAGFEVVGYYEPKPRDLRRGHDDPTKYYSIQKANKVPATMIFVCLKPPSQT
jgi:SAM-dependent methyltransferase